MPPRSPFERLGRLVDNFSPGFSAQVEELRRQMRAGLDQAGSGPADPQAEAFVTMLYDAVEGVKKLPWSRGLPGKMLRRFLRNAVTEIELSLLPDRSKAFELLGVRRADGVERVKKKYRALARLHHPDLPGGSHDKMQELNRAYEIVCRIKGEK